MLRSYEMPSFGASRDASGSSVKTNPSKPEDVTIVNACLALLAPQVCTGKITMEFDGFEREHKDPRRLDINPAWESYKEVSEHRGGYFEFLFALDDKNPVPDDKLASLACDRYQEALASLLEESFYPMKLETPFLSSEQNFDQLVQRIEKSADAYYKSRRPWLQNCAKTLVEARRVRAQTMEWSDFAGLKAHRRHQRSTSKEQAEVVLESKSAASEESLADKRRWSPLPCPQGIEIHV
jgi:hypothetical protein